MAYCYILYSKKLDKYYVGATKDCDRRLYEHNLGCSVFTSKGIPWELRFKEEFADLQSAKSREKYIKRQKSRKYIEKLIERG